MISLLEYIIVQRFHFAVPLVFSQVYKSLGSIALFRLKVFNIFATSSGAVRDKINVFVLLLVKKALKVF